MDQKKEPYKWQMDPFRAIEIIEGMIEVETKEEILAAAWQYLVDTGFAFQIQGSISSMAYHLIDSGEILPPNRRR